MSGDNVRIRAGVKGTVLAAVALATAIGGVGVGIGVALAEPSAHAVKAEFALVPLARVGLGWSIAESSTATAGVHPKKGKNTLYVVSPQGRKFVFYSWPAAKLSARTFHLVDVSGDGKRVLVANLYRYEQISLVTGKVVNSFKLPSSDMPVTYTRPSGLNLLLSVNGTVRRYDLNGKLAKVLSRNSDAAIESPDGTSVIVAARHGIDQVSNLGGVIKRLNGPASVLGCQPVRWWNAATVLVWCGAKHGPDAPRLWLFPLGGGRVSALTAQRNGRGPDFGDIDAWTLTSGVYLQALGACGSEFIATQSRNGSAHHVVIPGVNYASDRIITGFRSSLLVEADNGCSPGASLVWFNPHTKKVTWVIRGLKQGGGLDSVVSFGRPVS